MKQHRFLVFTGLVLAALIVAACTNKDNTTSPAETTTTAVPEIYKKLYGAADLYVEGSNLVVTSKSLPDHKSPYYLGTTWSATMYEAYNGSNPNFVLNPNRIAQQSLTFRIPLNPVVAATHQATPLGPIGVSLNGVPFYNQYAAGNQPLTGEVNSFDQYNGHPQQFGGYHYHVEPAALTTTKGSSALLGFLLDGFPVYGPKDGDSTVVSGNLDVYHGHTHATTEFPGGTYHYHTTAQSPYINGSGFYGTPGTVTQ